jgi:hypothetical protein
VSSVICLARTFIVRSGRSARPATSQPSRIDSIAMIASAIPDSVSSAPSVWVRWKMSARFARPTSWSNCV